MDIEDLSNLIELHGTTIYRFCYKLAGNKVDTDDLYQETFLKAMEVRHKIDMNHNPKSYLISIAIQLHKNKHRKFVWRQKIAPVVVLSETVDKVYWSEIVATPEDVVLSNELRSIINTAVDSLNDKLKIPLYLYYTAEMSIDEVASALRIPAGTVKSRLYKARMAMKKILEVESP
ncbi:MAG: RNA polymerase sigma factor [Candidatus Pristimantibacillus sp.]